jgi:hypothetical protein
MHKIAVGRTVGCQGRSRPPQQTEYRCRKNSQHPGLALHQSTLIADGGLTGQPELTLAPIGPITSAR